VSWWQSKWFLEFWPPRRPAEKIERNAINGGGKE